MSSTDGKQQALKEFLAKVDRLRSDSCRKKIPMTEDKFNEHILKTHFADIASLPEIAHENPHSRLQTGMHHSKMYLILRILAVFLFLALLYSPLRQAIASLFMKNIQSCIYSGMSLWRLITVPIIRIVPALTELYDESCLIENPLFQIQDMDCRPCHNVLNVLNLSDLDGQQDVVGGGVPYIFKVI